jgi:DNA-binding response OmpR family regulator
MKKRVLYVEDEEDSFHGVLQILREDNIDVELTRAGGVKEFWEAYAKGGWDLILLDVRLPEAETEAHVDNDAGVKIIKTLKYNNNLTSVIVVSGRWQSDPVWQTIEGIEFIRGMVFKPIEEAILCKYVREALYPQKMVRERIIREQKR